MAWNKVQVVLWPQETCVDLCCLRGRSQLKEMTIALSSQEDENQPFIHSEVPEGPSVGRQGRGGEHCTEKRNQMLKSELGVHLGTSICWPCDFRQVI